MCCDQRALSSIGLERLTTDQEVGGSNPLGRTSYLVSGKNVPIAQLEEPGISNPQVGGSSPSGHTVPREPAMVFTWPHYFYRGSTSVKGRTSVNI